VNFCDAKKIDGGTLFWKERKGNFSYGGDESSSGAPGKRLREQEKALPTAFDLKGGGPWTKRNLVRHNRWVGKIVE